MQSEDFYDIVAIIFNQIQLKLLIIKKHFKVKFLFNALYHALYIPHIVQLNPSQTITMKNSSLHRLCTYYDSNENVLVMVREVSKNFWRRKVDIYIIKHTNFHILEIACFLSKTSAEVSRVYTSFPALIALLPEKNFPPSAIRSLFWRKY